MTGAHLPGRTVSVDLNPVRPCTPKAARDNYISLMARQMHACCPEALSLKPHTRATDLLQETNNWTTTCWGVKSVLILLVAY